MDRALWLLTKLRIKGWLRRMGRGLRSVKGILLAVVGLAVFVPSFLPMLVMPRPGAAQLDMVRRFGPMILLAYCVLGLLTRGTGERAIAFSPAEINLLFPAPFRSRQLLAYKVITTLGTVLLTAPLIAIFVSQHAPSFLSALVGLALALCGLQLFAMLTALAAETVGVLAYNRRRRLVLAGLVILVAAIVLPLGSDVQNLPPLEILKRVEHATALQVALTPFRPFLQAFTAERIWPDLVRWGGIGLLIDAALVVAVFALNAQYLELSATASAKLYERIERVRRGGGVALLRSSGRKKRSLPMPPLLHGVGPIAWRQLTTARRDVVRLLLGMVVLFPMIVPVLVNSRQNQNEKILVGMLAGLVPFMTFVLTSMLTFDFRGDIDRLPELKALPIGSIPLVAGQLVAPVLIVTALQWIPLVIVAAWIPTTRPVLSAVAALAIPFNILLIGLDNLWFLIFPFRTSGGTNAFDFQTMGRVMLTMLAKMICLGVVGGLAAGLGAGVYYLTGQSWLPAIVMVWLVLAVFAAALLPLVALAFDRFDVARDTPA